MYVLEKVVRGKPLRARLSPSLEWSGDEPLVSVCRDVHHLFTRDDSPVLGESAGSIASTVADALKCRIVEKPTTPTYGRCLVP
ncbi:MAG: hypothetical protein KY475_25385 [Planctomycetes bacterium]|nr:hypothetical protein [Planctomycetota bacterium]